MLQYKLVALETSPTNKAVICKKFRYLQGLPPTSTEYLKSFNWLRHALTFPYNKCKELPVTLQQAGSSDGNSAAELPFNADVAGYVTSVYKKLDAYIYGMPEIKEDLLSYVCKRISNPNSNDHVLALQGCNGVGKTRLAHGLAKALDLPIRQINLGSVNDVSYFTGHGFTYVDSEPGRVVQMLNETQCSNMIILFDELDKVHHTEKGQAIYAYLTHLIDNSQNTRNQDVYLSGLELDVSRIFFVFTFNNIEAIDATVRDRLKIVKVQEPSSVDKGNIAEKFILPELCLNMKFSVQLDRAVIDALVMQQKELGGLRGVKRVLEDILGKLNVSRMLDRETQKQLTYWANSPDHMIRNIMTKHGKDDAFSSLGMYV
jgi:ATP-dependent Lon protease